MSEANKALSKSRQERDEITGINTYDLMDRAMGALDKYETGEISARDLDSIHKMLNYLSKMAALHVKHTQLSGEKPSAMLKSFSILDSRKEIAKAIEASSK